MHFRAFFLPYFALPFSTPVVTGTNTNPIARICCSQIPPKSLSIGRQKIVSVITELDRREHYELAPPATFELGHSINRYN
jgi:hypothetical protein